MRRRDLIVGLAASELSAWPLAVRAQQPKVPIVGVLFGGSAALLRQAFPPFLVGLRELGYRDGQDVTIEYRIAEGQYERLPALASDLVGRHADVIFAGASPASLAAKAATLTIPIVFSIGADPVALGLVASLNRPGGNVTGTTFLSIELTAKQLEMLHELCPNAGAVGFLISPAAPDAAAQTSRAEAAARALGLALHVVTARVDGDFEPAFAALAERHAGALLVGGDEFLMSRATRILELANRHAIPAVGGIRPFALAGGLASYGASFAEALYQAGLYAGRVLKGTKPADLPVVQATKFELVINLKTAEALGLAIPQTVLLIADEVIE
jgi:putative tryptophan/tyrosine transport system substrate-binding protein